MQRQSKQRRLDLHRAADGDGAGARRSIHLVIRIDEPLDRPRPHVQLDRGLARDHRDFVPAPAKDRMHPHAVLILKRLALCIDGRERECRGVERVDALVRGVVSSRCLAHEPQPLDQAGVAGPKGVDRPIARMCADLRLERDVDIVEFTQADQLGFAHQATEFALTA